MVLQINGERVVLHYMVLYSTKKGSAIVYKLDIVTVTECFLVLYRTIYSTFSINLKNLFTILRTYVYVVPAFRLQHLRKRCLQEVATLLLSPGHFLRQKLDFCSAFWSALVETEDSSSSRTDSFESSSESDLKKGLKHSGRNSMLCKYEYTVNAINQF